MKVFLVVVQPMNVSFDDLNGLPVGSCSWPRIRVATKETDHLQWYYLMWAQSNISEELKVKNSQYTTYLFQFKLGAETLSNVKNESVKETSLAKPERQKWD